MKLKKIGTNETELTTKEGNRLFFSYETLVAVRTQSTVYVTDEKYSNTTTQHINKWVGNLNFENVSQNQLEEVFG